MRQIHVLLTLSEDEANALAAVGQSTDEFVRVTRSQWERLKRDATEMQSWSPEPQTREQRQEYAKSWGMK